MSRSTSLERHADACRRLAAAMTDAECPAEAIAAARAGQWSDFRSELPLPKTALVEILMYDGKRELAQRVADGEFDG